MGQIWATLFALPRSCFWLSLFCSLPTPFLIFSLFWLQERTIKNLRQELADASRDQDQTSGQVAALQRQVTALVGDLDLMTRRNQVGLHATMCLPQLSDLF